MPLSKSLRLACLVDSEISTTPRLDDITSALEEATILHDDTTSMLEHGTADINSPPITRRRLGDTEASYFLPSRESGVNDMYLKLGLNASARLMTRNRARIIWAILRCRHPLLASFIQMESYDDIYFKHALPDSAESALSNADASLEYRSENPQQLLDSYLNGPRTLSDQRLSYLIISSTSENGSISEDKAGDDISFDLLICSTHFLGDGMALHQLAHELLNLLGGPANESDLMGLLEREVTTIKDKFSQSSDIAETYIPLSLEERLPTSPASKIYAAATLVDHLSYQRRQIGGHAFPRSKTMERRTIVPTLSYDAKKTTTILHRCKENGVSISSAVFALCNIAWAQVQTKGWELPMMMYSALNIRPYLEANERLNKSYFFLCIGFFNIVLPSFIPRGADSSKIFWHRARLVKSQTAKIAKSPCLVSRSKEMAKERGMRARMWAMHDDGILPTIMPPKRSLFEEDVTKVPSSALIGLSMLGNLDGIYKHRTFPSIKLHTLTTGSRQRQGGMLLFGYTFVGKLWLSLGYDVNGFDDDVVQAFWRNLLTCVDEFLCQPIDVTSL